MSLLDDCKEFTNLYLEKTGKVVSGNIDVIFISKMVRDEMEELVEAKDEAEQVDALLDATYYILQHLSTTNLDLSEWLTLELGTRLWPVNYKTIQVDMVLTSVEDKLVTLSSQESSQEQVNVLMDIARYLLFHITEIGIRYKPIWKLIHNANMTKFGPGGYVATEGDRKGKWCKPNDFVAPDDDIRKEIVRQRFS